MARHRDLELRYGADPTRLPHELRCAFVELDFDDGTRAWIDAALDRPDPSARLVLRNLATTLVNIFDANAWMDIGQDRLLSTTQWRRLLGAGATRLLDVGAGAGDVTRELAALFSDVATTELSRPAARRLRDKGFTCHECDITFERLDDADRFDVVALQNVIDRTTHPLRLLDQIQHLLARDGHVVVAVPVPVRPVVFIGRTRFDPAETLPTGMPDFESAVGTLYEQVFRPRGYRVEAIARAPYLSRGGARSPVEVLDDAIFVLTRPNLSARAPSPCGSTRAAKRLPGPGTSA